MLAVSQPVCVEKAAVRPAAEGFVQPSDESGGYKDANVR
jgi:hypothetical protein